MGKTKAENKVIPPFVAQQKKQRDEIPSAFVPDDDGGCQKSPKKTPPIFRWLDENRRELLQSVRRASGLGNGAYELRRTLGRGDRRRTSPGDEIRPFGLR